MELTLYDLDQFDLSLPSLGKIEALTDEVRIKSQEYLASLRAQGLGVAAIEFSVSTGYYDDNSHHGDTSSIDYLDENEHYMNASLLDDLRGVRAFERSMKDVGLGLAEMESGDGGNRYALAIYQSMAVLVEDQSDGMIILQIEVFDRSAPNPLLLPAEAAGILRTACEGLEEQESAILFVGDDDENLQEMVTASTLLTGEALRDGWPDLIQRWQKDTRTSILVSRISEDCLIVHGLAGYDSEKAGPLLGLVWI